MEAGLPSCTTSIGSACTISSGPALATLLAQADAALYTAKQEGRNAVRMASGPQDHVANWQGDEGKGALVS